MFYTKKYIHFKKKNVKTEKDNVIPIINGGSDTENKINFKEISSGSNKLCLDIYNNINEEQKIFSPISITFALSLIHQGSQGNTELELTNLFNHKYSLNELNYILTLFNNDIVKMTNMFIINKNNPINKEYINQIKKLTQITVDDFTNKEFVVKKVNDYIENNTNKLIKNVISVNDIDNNTVFVLINTIYFIAKWYNEFQPKNTKQRTFNVSEKKKMIDMMYQKNKFLYYENDSIQIIEMFYKDKNYCMGIILPKNSNIIPKLFSLEEITQLINKLKYEEIDLYFPKFKQRKNINLIPILQKLGIEDLFTSKADLKGMGKEVYVSKIIHEAVIIVDEKGTEAAAATVIMMERTGFIQKKQPKLFKADHPFTYYIKHVPTNIFLFFGDFYGN